MPQVSKVKKFGLEKDVIDLYKRGLRDQAISTELNQRNHLSPPLNRQNIQNFLATVPSEILRSAKAKHDESVFDSILPELRDHIGRIQTILFPKLMEEINRGKDIAKIRVFGNLYKDVFKIVANIEGLGGSEKIMRAEYDDIIQEQKEAREFIKSVHAIVCPACKVLIRNAAKAKKKMPVTLEKKE